MIKPTLIRQKKGDGKTRFPILTAKPSLWLTKYTFFLNFFSKEPFSEDQLLRKLEEQVIRKTLVRNHRVKRYEDVPRTDVCKSSNRPSN